MKDLNLLVWLLQLGLSIAIPFAGFLLLAFWLQNQFHLGDWVIWVGVVVGLISAIDSFRNSLKLMLRLSKSNSEKGPPPTAFNEHD